MDIIFVDPATESEFNDSKKLRRKHGELRSKRIKQRLEDLASARCLADMRSLPGRCHELTGDRSGQLSLDLDHPYRLLFRPVGDKRKEDGGINWMTVDAVEVIGIEDTH